MNPFDWASIAAPPYGLEVISNYLKHRFTDIETKIVNPFIDEGNSLGQLIRQYKPELIGLSMRNLDNMANIWSDKVIEHNGIKTGGFVGRIGNIVSKIKSTTDVDIIIGGAGFSVAPELILKRIGLDIGIVGPGEKTIGKIVGALKTGRLIREFIVNEHESLKGIVYLSENKIIKELPEHCMEQDKLDNFERVNQYSYKWTGSVPVRVSTGCTGKCSFCVEGTLFKNDERRNNDDIVEEIKLIKASDAAVWLTCSEFNYPYEDKVIELCERIKKAGIKRRFSSYFLPKPFSVGMYNALKSIGFIDHSICFGIIHVSDAILQRNAASFCKNDINKVIKIFKDVGAEGITVGCILGLPGETKETLDEMVLWMKEIDGIFGEGFRCSYNCGVRVYPNTPLAEKVVSGKVCSDYLYGNIEDAELLEPLVYSCPYSPKEINVYIKEKIKDCKGLISSYNMGNEMMNDNCSVIIDWQKAQYLQREDNVVEALKKLVQAYGMSEIGRVKDKLMTEIIQTLIVIKKQYYLDKNELLEIVKNTIFEKMVF